MFSDKYIEKRELYLRTLRGGQSASQSIPGWSREQAAELAKNVYLYGEQFQTLVMTFYPQRSPAELR